MVHWFRKKVKHVKVYRNSSQVLQCYYLWNYYASSLRECRFYLLLKPWPLIQLLALKGFQSSTLKYIGNMFKIHSKNYNATGCNIHSANILIDNKFYIVNTRIPVPWALFFNKPSNVKILYIHVCFRLQILFSYINKM